MVRRCRHHHHYYSKYENLPSTVLSSSTSSLSSSQFPTTSRRRLTLNKNRLQRQRRQTASVHIVNFVVPIVTAIVVVLVTVVVDVLPVTAYQGNININSSNNSSNGGNNNQKHYHLQQQQKQPNPNPMRAWTCHGRNQIDLVDRLRQAGIVKTSAVQRVLEQVDRANYVTVEEDTTTATTNNPNTKNYSYMDAPQAIGLGQTVSAPHMHAHALEEIYPYLASKVSDAKNNNNHNHNLKILDVGCGSGYLTAALGRWIHPRRQSSGRVAVGGDDTTDRLDYKDHHHHHDNNILGAGPGSHVFGIDVRPELVELTTQNIMKNDNDLFHDGIVTVQVADGWKGLPDQSPFDAIHVGACAVSIPYDLVNQLAVGGVMIIPIGPQHDAQALYKIERIQQTRSGGGGGGTSCSSSTSANIADDDEQRTTDPPHRRTSDMPDNFYPEDFEMTKLLGVRYVPLIQVS